MWEILIVACLSYGIWLVGDAVYRRLRPKKKTLPKKPKRHLSGEQLLGKCRYEVGQKQTNVSTYPKAEQAMDKELKYMTKFQIYQTLLYTKDLAGCSQFPLIHI